MFLLPHLLGELVVLALFGVMPGVFATYRTILDLGASSSASSISSASAGSASASASVILIGASVEAWGRVSLGGLLHCFLRRLLHVVDGFERPAVFVFVIVLLPGRFAGLAS